MKVRNGFVSNSSSSSFILAFPNKDNISKNDVRENLRRDCSGYQYLVDMLNEDPDSKCYKKSLDNIEVAIEEGYLLKGYTLSSHLEYEVRDLIDALLDVSGVKIVYEDDD